MTLVPDTSAILSLAFTDEDADYASRVVDAIVNQGGAAPTLFWFELRNALIMGERRGRIAANISEAFLANVEALPIKLDSYPSSEQVIRLARSYGLTVYDAAYLELSLRLDAPLATVDNALVRAASSVGVKIWT